jgi:protein arginine N-methyltransferase 5
VQVARDVSRSRGFAGSFDFVSAPLVHPRFRRAFGKDGFTRNTPFTRSDMLLSSAGACLCLCLCFVEFVLFFSEWTRLVVGKISPWLNLDSTVFAERRSSEEAFLQELRFACHLGVPAVQVFFSLTFFLLKIF